MILSAYRLTALLVLSLFYCFSSRGQTPSFTAPDTVCPNIPVNIINTSVGGTTFYWSFCQADLNQTPKAVNLGNIGGLLSEPVFLDVVSENNNYYGFLVNHIPGRLIRLDFGNNMLNTPTAHDLGDFGGIINRANGSEGIQVIRNNGNWYALIVGGNPAVGTDPKIVQINFGSTITNLSPKATDWGNLGDMLQSVDFYVFNENSHWYGFTVNAVNNTITRFDFGTSFDSPPTAINMGNPGGMLNYPTGICAVNDAGSWHVFIISQVNSSLIRLDFGNSLLNTPVPVNLGNPGNTFQAARDLRIIKSCDQIIGFVADGTANDLIRIDFHNDLLSVPDGVSLGNIGNFDFAHSLSKLFRVGSDMYTFIPNVDNNTLTRVRFPGCNSTSIPNATVKDPPPVSYSQPGTYRINLIMDDGLPTASSFCKNIVVRQPPDIAVSNDTVLCTGASVQLLVFAAGNYTYSWYPVIGLSDPSIPNPIATPPISGYYHVKATDRYSCSTVDSILVKVKPPDFFKISPSPANLCIGDTMILKVSGGFPDSKDTYQWIPAVTGQDPGAAEIAVSPAVSTLYQVIGYDEICQTSDVVSVTVNVLPRPITRVTKSNDIDCIQGQATLYASGGIGYSWYPTNTLSDSTTATPIASVDTTTRYYVWVTGKDGCVSRDSIQVNVTKDGLSNGYPVANAFTPNGDGHNDCFGIRYWGYIGDMEMSIYDRWGVRVYYSQNREQCWDGTYHGQIQPAGAYIYIIKAHTLCGNVTKRGTVMLIR